LRRLAQSGRGPIATDRLKEGYINISQGNGPRLTDRQSKAKTILLI